MPKGTCKFCGCTTSEPCVSPDGDTCSWCDEIDQDVCSACLLRAIDAGPDANDPLGLPRYLRFLGQVQIGMLSDVRTIQESLGQIVMYLHEQKAGGKLWTPGMGS